MKIIMKSVSVPVGYCIYDSHFLNNLIKNSVRDYVMDSVRESVGDSLIKIRSTYEKHI